MKFLALLGNYDRQTDRHYCKSSQLFIFHSSVQKMEQVLRWEHGSVTERKSTGQLSNQPTIQPSDEPTERYQGSLTLKFNTFKLSHATTLLSK